MRVLTFRYICLLAFLLGVYSSSAHADPPPVLSTVVSNIERRYNSLATLVVSFEQHINFGARPAIHEAGTLYLQRPSRMRWDYTKPFGKLLIADGETMQMYNPRTNQVRHLKFSATADFRAPLSFLLGRLRLRRQFRNLRLAKRQEQTVLLGDGRTGKEAYRAVEFSYDASDYRLLRLELHGHDQSITTFEFSDEKVNTSLRAALFVFDAPPGAEILKGVFVENSR